MAQKCVHQGCGKNYTDPDEVCRYHPGPPVFHEGQKGMFSGPSSSGAAETPPWALELADAIAAALAYAARPATGSGLLCCCDCQANLGFLFAT